jgi:quercetin dioxygenase-like cupin family protein
VDKITAFSIKKDTNSQMTISAPYTMIPDVNQSVLEIPVDSIVSRTIYRDKSLKAIVFAFAPGQELSEHTASVPAVIQILEGECEVTVGEDHFDARGGFWVRMAAKLPHSLLARTPVKMLLLMLSDSQDEA